MWFNSEMNAAPPPRTGAPPEKPQIRTIALIGKYHSREIADSLRLLAQHLRERGIEVLLEANTAGAAGESGQASGVTVCDYAAIGREADLAIVLGGDGTMLSAARQLARHHVPLVGVNQGHLGFMTDIARCDMLTGIDDLLAGRFSAETRMLLDAEVLRAGETISSNLALNEIVIDKGAFGRLIEFELYIDGEFVFALRSDGLIVATPTGSTAYSLSAGGPILHPRVTGFSLVPLCPHSLTNRPILIDDRSRVEVGILQGDDSRAYFDGQVICDLRPGDRLRIRRSPDSICFLHPPAYSYYGMLREKLQWNEQPRFNSVNN